MIVVSAPLFNSYKVPTFVLIDVPAIKSISPVEARTLTFFPAVTSKSIAAVL